MNDNQIQFKCVFRYSLVQCLYYYCGALSISLNGSSDGRDVSALATPATPAFEVINTTHRRSPLVQGGLEIPVKVAVEIEATAKNRLIIDKYKELVLANYKEPDLNGHFDDCTKDVLKELHVQEEEMSDSDEDSAEVDDK